MLLYLDRHHLRRWVQHRREERALLQDFRGRRRHAGTDTARHK